MEFERFAYLNPNLFHFVERKDMPDWSIKKRHCGFHELYFIMGGKAVFLVNGEKYTTQAGDIVYVPGGSIREAHTFADYPIHAYALNFHWLNDNHVSLPFDIVMNNKMNADLLIYLTEMQLIMKSNHVFGRFKERAMFMLLLNHLFQLYFYKSFNQVDPRIKTVLHYIDEHYADTVEMNMLARMTNLHAVYLGKLFKENTGETLKMYLIKIRMNKAEQLLAAGNCSVSKVAEKCGFNDIYYFSKVFKRIKGYAPSTVIKRAKFPIPYE